MGTEDKTSCLFIVTIFVNVWFGALISRDAPLNDICLLQSLESNAKVDDQMTGLFIQYVALKKKLGYLWYPSMFSWNCGCYINKAQHERRCEYS
jgi:hypothetical protein